MAFGLRPIGMTSSDEVIPINEYPMGTSASAIYNGDPVTLDTNGVVVVCAAGDLPIGVFAGCTYFDSAGKLVTKPNYDAPAGESDIKALVHDSPQTIFEVLANDTVTQANVGALYDISYAAGSATSGVSGVTLDVSSLATTGKTLRMTKLSNRVGDNARVVQVIFAEHSLLGISSGAAGV